MIHVFITKDVVSRSNEIVKNTNIIGKECSFDVADIKIGCPFWARYGDQWLKTSIVEGFELTKDDNVVSINTLNSAYSFYRKQ